MKSMIHCNDRLHRIFLIDPYILSLFMDLVCMKVCARVLSTFMHFIKQIALEHTIIHSKFVQCNNVTVVLTYSVIVLHSVFL